MDPHWQPHLEHPPTAVAVTQEARGLFAAGWHAGADECRIVNLASQLQQIVSPQTWHAMRELSASVPAHLTY
ncbi:MAG: hypothetical protein JWQ33_2159 [Ramlibacter sp.]|nr:hypothetical protein [Ramlibacter sp.]